jgi:hypothetical protein
MTKIQNLVLNYIALVVAIVSYIILKIYSSFYYLQIVQKLFLMLIFLSGLILIINNFFNLKKSNKKIITVLFVCLGIVLVIYSGLALYLIFALQNTGF